MERFSLSDMRLRLMLLVLVAVTPAFGLAFYTDIQERELAAHGARAEALRLARLAAADQEQLVEGARQLLVTLARLPEVRNRDADGCRALFSDLLKDHHRYANLGAMTEEGDVFCSAHPVAGANRGENTGLTTAARHALAAEDFSVGDYQIHFPGRRKDVVVFTYPAVGSTGPSRVVVFAALDLTWVNQVAAELQLPSDSTLSVIDRNGVILIRHPDGAQWRGKPAPEASLVRGDLGERRESTLRAVGTDGVARLYASTMLRGAEGAAYVTVGIPVSVAFAATDRILRVNLAGLGLAAGLVLVGTWLGGNLFILHRMNVLVRTTERLRAGDLSVRTGLPPGPGELSQLGYAIDQMAAALEQREVERARAEEEIRQLNADLERRVVERTAQLEAANKELEAFSYSVSHDLRAPLRAMAGFSRILTEDFSTQLPADAVRYLGRIQDNAQRMGNLIDDLLRFSRLGRQAVSKQNVLPGDLVRQVLDDLQGERDGRRIDLVIGELPPCLADPALLKQVYVNLLTNALKFTRSRDAARIEVGCRTGDGEAVYYVKDNGVGFDMQYANKLFGVFQRLHDAKAYEGTGVGLAIVQRVIARHGGRLWAEAEVENGAAFYFTLGVEE